MYRGLKPVYWCFDCGSSLAEFEIEYQDKKSTTLDVAFKAHNPAALAAAFGVPALTQDAFAVIWTTTAWTIPANQALNLNPELPYSLVETERGLYVVAETLVDACMERWGLQGKVLATVPGENWAASSLSTRCTTWPVKTAAMATAASRPCTWPTTPRPPTARVSCTRRPPTAWTTSTRAWRTA